jgi:hypothetical protein
MVEALSKVLSGALEAGDLDAARIAHEAMGRLLEGTPTTAPTAPMASVSDLAARRRGGR